MFFLNGVTIPLTVDIVALIIGMPNNGILVSVDSGLLQKEENNPIKAEFREIIDREVSTSTFIRHLIHFLFSNFLFCSPYYKISAKLLSYDDDLKIFGKHNWATALYSFLIT